MHNSAIETGRVVPRYDTLLDLVRVLEYDLVHVPRQLVPVVEALVRDHRKRQSAGYNPDEEQPLYSLDDLEEELDES